MSELVDKQMHYWKEFLAHAQRNGNGITGAWGPHESTANELLVNVGGGSGIELRAWMDRREGFIAVALYLTGEGKHDAYRSLTMQRSTIDSALGDQSSEWRKPGEGRRAGYVAMTQLFADPMEESDWPTQFKWLREKLERFDEMFSPIVGDL